MSQESEETFLEGAETALDLAFGLGRWGDEMGDAQGLQGALEFAFRIGVIGAGTGAEEA